MPAVQTIGKTEKLECAKLLQQVGDGKIGRYLLHLIQSRHTILYVQTTEESRVIKCLNLISLMKGYDLFQWDCYRGLLDIFDMQQVKSSNNEVHDNPVAVLGHIIEHAKNDRKKMQEKKEGNGHIYILPDFNPFLRDNPETQRQLKYFASIHSVCCIVFISPVFECPDSLQKEVTLVDFPPPSKSELRNVLSKIKDHIPVHFPSVIKYANEHEDELLNAVSGLGVVEADNAYALSLIRKNALDIPTILNEKKQIIRKSGILEFREPRFTFDDVGGLDILKQWLDRRKLAFSESAQAFGLSQPSGVLLCGTPGTGKSMICDALAAHWQMPLLRLDIGAIFSPHIGDSEANIRTVVRTAESISPCVLWWDEAEKGIGGVQSSNATDGGVTNRVFATLLTWMQEKQHPVFVVCTANNVTSIPPEFMRAGRFDEIFFVDLPNHDQRVDVLERLLLRKKRNPEEFDLEEIARQSEFYSPAELEKAINNALFVAFSEKARQVTTKDITSELKKFQPLYNTRREEIESMREWALGEDGKGGRAVLANSCTEELTPKEIDSVSRDLKLSEDDI